MGTLYEESCVTQHHITHLVYTLYTHRYCRICTYKHPLYLYMHTIYTSVYTPLNTLYTPYIHLIYTQVQWRVLVITVKSRVVGGGSTSKVRKKEMNNLCISVLLVCGRGIYVDRRWMIR